MMEQHCQVNLASADAEFLGDLPCVARVIGNLNEALHPFRPTVVPLTGFEVDRQIDLSQSTRRTSSQARAQTHPGLDALQSPVPLLE